MTEHGPAVQKLIELSQVAGYQRRTKSGKVVDVAPYSSNRSGQPTRAVFTALGRQEFAGRVVKNQELALFLAKMLGRQPTTKEVQNYAQLFKVKKVVL